VLSQRDHHTVILAKIFNSSQIESVISAVGFNAGQSVSEESYVFEKKCAEVLFPIRGPGTQILLYQIMHLLYLR